jgi:hypothetical protein
MFLFHGVHPKKITVPALILTLLASALAGSLFVNVAEAEVGRVDPLSTTIPPGVFILNLQNGTICNSLTIKLAYEVTPIDGPNVQLYLLSEVYYSTSWQQDKVYVYKDPTEVELGLFSGTLELKGMPQGVNSVTVTAVYYGLYWQGGLVWTEFTISGSSTVTFAVDLFPLRIRIQSPYPQAYATSDVALTFTINEKTSKLRYSLDDEAPVTITGNTTLAGLTSGNHNVTVYGVDEFGNPGASETISFTVTQAETSPTVAISAAVIASAAIIAFGLVAYFIRRKKKRSGGA